MAKIHALNIINLLHEKCKNTMNKILFHFYITYHMYICFVLITHIFEIYTLCFKQKLFLKLQTLRNFSSVLHIIFVRYFGDISFSLTHIFFFPISAETSQNKSLGSHKGSWNKTSFNQMILFFNINLTLSTIILKFSRLKNQERISKVKRKISLIDFLLIFTD